MLRFLLITVLAGQLFGQNIWHSLDSLDRQFSARIQGKNQYPALDIAMESWALGTPALEWGTATYRMNRNSILTKKIIMAEILAGTISITAKYMIRRPRPERSYRPRLWNTRITPSFPSGHTAAYAAFSTVMAQQFPHYRTLWIGSAVFTGISHLYTGNHYSGDVLAGLVVGYLSGWIVTR
ncbi:MAG: phosphatase PAP2 family protein [Fidelibacterota bacterium]